MADQVVARRPVTVTLGGLSTGLETREITGQAIDPDVLIARIEFAISHYSQRNDVVNDMIDLYKQKFTDIEAVISRERKDIMPDVAHMDMVKPGRAAAIQQKLTSYMFYSARPRIEVPPLKAGNTKGEDRLCSKLEAFCHGLIDEARHETQKAWPLDYFWWYLVGGLGTIKVRYFPQLKGDSGEMPIKLFAVDTRDVFPVIANGRTFYVVEQYNRYVMDLQEEFANLAVSSGSKKLWETPYKLFDRDGTEEVTVTEYWDKTAHALYVDGSLVWNKEHGYPCIPYSFGACYPAPLSEGDWHNRPYFSFVEDAIKNEAYTRSKLQTALELHFWPPIIVKDPQGAVNILRTGPGVTTPVAPGTTVEVLNVRPATDLANLLLAQFVDEITMGTLPQVMFGQPNYPSRSGLSEQFRFAGTEADLAFMATTVGAGLADALSNVLALVERFAGDEGMAVYSRLPGSPRHEVLKLTGDDVKGHHKVMVQMRPLLTKDKLQEMQFARMGRERSPVTGRPLFSDRYIHSNVFHVDDPATLDDEINQEQLSSDARVQTWNSEQAFEDFVRREGITKKQLEELMEKVAGPPREAPEEPMSMPIPPPREEMGQGEMEQGEPPEWGIGPGFVAPEQGGVGRMDQMTPAETEEWLAGITGRPRGS